MTTRRSFPGGAAWLLLTAVTFLCPPPGRSQEFRVIAANFPHVYASSIAWGDYNNDGYLDVAIIGTRDSVNSPVFRPSLNVARIYRNNGNGTFTDISAGLMPVMVGTVAWGDYDNDGYLDLLYGGVDTLNNQVTKLYRNNRNGTFTENTGSGFHSSSYGSVAWGDYDNDGDMDIVVPDVGVWPNRTGLTLSLLYNIAICVDADGDGVADLVIYRSGVWFIDTNRNGTPDVIAYFGGATSGVAGFRNMEATVASLTSLVTYFIPILALTLGGGIIADEHDKGTLEIYLASPITPAEFITGKFLGLAVALSLAMVAGLGVSGLALIIGSGMKAFSSYLVFMMNSASAVFPRPICEYVFGK